MTFIFKQPEETKSANVVTPESMNVDELSKPSRYGLQRASQKWKRDAPPEYRNLLDAELVKDE
jgi:hypothetical protein